MEAADADSAAAMTMARASGDPAAELDAIRARVAALSAPQHRTEWLRLGARTVELAAATGQPIAAVLGRVWRIDASYQLMNLQAVDTEIALIAQLAESTRLPLAPSPTRSPSAPPTTLIAPTTAPLILTP